MAKFQILAVTVNEPVTGRDVDFRWKYYQK
jgi:hypothetical protein